MANDSEYWHVSARRRLFPRLLVASFLTMCFSMGTVHADALPITEVAPGVYVHTGKHLELNKDTIGAISNSGFIIGDSSVMVIDPGGSLAAANALVEAIANATDLPIAYVVLSHFHPDHVAGAAAFGPGVEIIAHHRYPRALLQRSQFYSERFGLTAAHWSMGRPTQLVTDSVLIDIGNRAIEITAHATAHTDNDLSVFDSASNTLWASDLVFAQRTPSLDGSLNSWIAVLDMLERKKPSLVVPGHGESGDWESTVAPQIHYLTTLRDSVRKTLLSGSTLSKAIAEGEQENAMNWLLFETQHPVNITKAYTELEWE